MRAWGESCRTLAALRTLPPFRAGAAASDVVAFDTGPGNMVIDAVTERLFGRPFDRGGRIAASGNVLEHVIQQYCNARSSAENRRRPRGAKNSAGSLRGNFCDAAERARKQDVVATATALTAQSIADAVRRFVITNSSSAQKQAFHEMIVSGGGAKNSTLVARLTAELVPLGLQLRFSDEFGLPSAAKEAVAFAVLAHETWRRRASNIPSATGARRAAVLGKISYP